MGGRPREVAITSFQISVANGGDHVVRLAVEGEVNASTAPHLLGSMLYAAAVTIGATSCLTCAT